MRNYITLIAVTMLVVTAVFAKHADKMDADLVQGYYRELVADAAGFEPINDRTAKAIGQDGSVSAYLGIESNIGYGGPLLVGTVLSPEGAVKAIVILEHKETPSYIHKITKAGFFRQFDKKQAGDSLAFNYDVDGVSGATLSTRAIASSVQSVAHTIAQAELKITPKKAEVKWSIGIQEIVIALLFLLSYCMPKFKQLAKYRFPFLLLSVVILGFWLNRSLSMGQISALFLGYFPVPGENLLWYIVLIGAFAPALFTGKNLYCTYVCPFCGLQETTHKISRINLALGKYMKWIRLGKEVILFLVLFLAFLALNPSVSSFEPFGTIFGLNGSSYQWYLLFVILLSSFFIRRFWCHAFCPVGTILDKAAGLSRKAKNKLGPLINTKKAVGVKHGK